MTFPTLIHERVEQARAGTNPAVLARMRSGWAVLGDTQFLPGYSLLLPDPVVSSLNDLGISQRADFLLDMADIGDALLSALESHGVIRINYEILGNTEPALHAHIFPRYAHEPDEQRRNPVWSYGPEVWKNVRQDEASEQAVRQKIVERLSRKIDRP